MKWVRRGWRRLLGSFAGWRRESELADELSSHIEMQIEDNLRAGMTPEEAQRAAKLKFGSVESAKESYRDQRGMPWIDSLSSDFRFAARGLRKNWGFTMVAVATLALGIGANTTVFSLVEQVLLHPRGILNPERIVTVQTSYKKLHVEFLGASARTLVDLHESPEIFERAALSRPTHMNFTGVGEPQRLQTSAVTSEWFAVLGAKPSLGRVFTNKEDRPNVNRVVVLSHAAWLKLYGADSSVLGRTMVLNETPHRIVGVMPPEFRWPMKTDIWIPSGLPAEAFTTENRFNENQTLVARTKSGVSIRAANEWMSLFTNRIRNDPGDTIARDYGWGIAAVPFAEGNAGDTGKPTLVLLGAVGFVLLIVCSNVGGLLLARASARAHEFAVRAALGASRTRLMRALLAESLLLAALGGIAGLVFADSGVRLLLMLAPENVAIGLEPRSNVYVLLFCAAASIVSALLFGIAPAWQISRVGPHGALKSDDRGATAGAPRQRMRSGLVVVETGLALMLLVTGGLFLRSFAKLQSVDPGFQPRGVMTAMFWLPRESYRTPGEMTLFYRTLLDRLNGTAGVSSAALAWAYPFSVFNNAGIFEIEGRIVPPGQLQPHADRFTVTAEYFTTLGIPLKRGRFFTDQDRVSGERVAIIDANLASQYWPGEDPLDKRIKREDQTFRIVGIVGHVLHSTLWSRSDRGTLYFNLFQQPSEAAGILVKAAGDTAGMATVIRDAIHNADPHQAVSSFDRMEDLVSNSLAPGRFAMRLLGFFAVTALLLAAIGLYGVISYSVEQRKREIGVRVALGAESRQVFGMVLGNGLRLASLGVLIGIAGSLAGAQLIRSQLYETSPFDPLTIGVVALALLATAALASYLPARRAMRVDPVISLRAE